MHGALEGRAAARPGAACNAAAPARSGRGRGRVRAPGRRYRRRARRAVARTAAPVRRRARPARWRSTCTMRSAGSCSTSSSTVRLHRRGQVDQLAFAVGQVGLTEGRVGDHCRARSRAAPSGGSGWQSARPARSTPLAVDAEQHGAAASASPALVASASCDEMALGQRSGLAAPGGERELADALDAAAPDRTSAAPARRTGADERPARPPANVKPMHSWSPSVNSVADMSTGRPCRRRRGSSPECCRQRHGAAPARSGRRAAGRRAEPVDKQTPLRDVLAAERAPDRRKAGLASRMRPLESVTTAASSASPRAADA